MVHLDPFTSPAAAASEKAASKPAAAAETDFGDISSPITAATNATLAQNNIRPSLVGSSSNNNDSGGVVQAAGHGLLRLDPDRDGAIVKPTTRQECVTYECMQHDEHMHEFVRRFIPRYFTSWPMQRVVPGSKFTHEVSLKNLCRLDDEQVFHMSRTLSGTKSSSSSSSSSNSEQGAQSSSTVLYQSSPCVLDLKIGRYRHTKITPLRKYMRQMRKDSPTSARSVGLRICGVRHCRWVLDEEGEAQQEADENHQQKQQDVSNNNGKPLSRSARRAALRKRNEKAYKADESDSEIMQLPKALERAETKQQQQAQVRPTEEEFDILSWSEDKIFGRTCSPEEMLEALAMFCTVAVDVDSSIGRPQLCKDDKSAQLRFDPCPELQLLECFRSKVADMIQVIEKHNVLARYSFASASILFVHRWRIVEVASSTSSHVESRTRVLEIDADLRLVDFSSSGPIDMSLAALGTQHNAALRAGDEARNPNAAVLLHPTAAPNVVLAEVPKEGVMPLFSNAIIDFRFGLENLKHGLDALCEARKRMEDES